MELFTLHAMADVPRWAEGAAYVLVRETMGVQTTAMEHGARLLAEYVGQNPTNLEAQYWLGSAELALQKGAAAIPHLESVVSRDANWPEARFRLAIAFDQIQQYDRALNIYLDLVAKYPDWQELYPLTVRLLLYQNRAGEAVRLLEQQLKYQDDPTAYANLALARRLLGVPPNVCLPLADRAVLLDPRLALGYLHRGILLAESGQAERARIDLEHVLRLEPGNEKAKAVLQALSALRPSNR